MLTKQETLLERGAQVESSRVREPRRTALPRGLQPWGCMVLGLGWGVGMGIRRQQKDMWHVYPEQSSD